MSTQRPPTRWSELKLNDLFYAYRKAKADCFFERTILISEKFVAYEEKLFENLSALLNSLQTEPIDTILQRNLGEPIVVAKKLTKTLKATARKQAHAYFSDPSKFFDRLQATHFLNPEFRLVGDFPVEMHLLSALWVNLVGHKFDASPGGYAYGSRLRRYRAIHSPAPKTLGEYHLEALGSFQPYFEPYKSWRANGLAAVRSELDADRGVVAISLDLANYYHRIDPSFISLPGFLKEIGLELTAWEKEFTAGYSKALLAWSDAARQRLASLGARLAPDDLGGIPIGLSAARVFANILLKKLDEQFIRNLTPVYYGRYVDDMFLVIRDPGNLPDADALFQWIEERVDVFKKRAGTNVTDIDLGRDYAGKSAIELQNAKQKVFFLRGSVGLDLLLSIENEIREVSSERRLLPDPDALEQMTAARVLVAAESADEEVDTLRRANGLSVRRLGWSILLLHMETLARDLNCDEWLNERTRFYKFASAHILRPDRILDHADYLPRLLSLAVELRDWAEARKLWADCRHSVAELRRAAADQASATKESGDQADKVNGYPLPSTSESIWSELLERLREVCADAVLRALPWHKTRGLEPAGTAAKELFVDLSLGDDTRLVAERALRLREADWARVSYKDHLRRDARNSRKPQSHENALLRLYRFSDSLLEFLRKSSVTEDAPSATRTRFHYRKSGLKGLGESLVPYLFPTRPYTTVEISLYAPSCIQNTKEWARYVSAVRGLWVREWLHDGAIDGPSEAKDKIWRIGESEKDPRVVLGITNLLTTDDSWRASADGAPDLGRKRYQRLGVLLNQATHANPRPTHLLLPELSVPERWLNSISRVLKESRISLIAGLEYHHHRRGAKIHSDAVLLLTDNRLGYPSWIELRQPKAEPAPAEEQRLLRDFGLHWARASSVKPIYNHQGFHFGVLVCSELQNIKHRQNFQGKIDCLMVLSWNQDIETFSSLIESAALDVHAYIALVNNLKYGDSRVRVPAKELFDRDVCRLRGGNNDYFVVVQLDIKSLREFQSRHKRWSEPGDNFKPVPEGFCISPGRKVTPQ